MTVLTDDLASSKRQISNADSFAETSENGSLSQQAKNAETTGLADRDQTLSVQWDGQKPALEKWIPNKGFGDRDYSWSREHYSRSSRYLHIWKFVLTLLTGLWYDSKSWSYPGGLTDEKKARRRRRQAIWIRETILDLGPTFIKVGQLFSTRADLFPGEYVEELSKLQDRVPAFSYSQVEDILLKDLGKGIPSLFRYFDPIPLAAASLGQVHKAQLHSGEEVVVKVQRPGLKRLFEIDLSILKGITHFFQNHPKWGKGRDWIGVYEECRRILWEEIDYLNEGRNADEFRRNFRTRPWAKVPRVYWRYSSRRVLTLEYLPGIKISNYEAIEAAGLDRDALARMGAEAYLHQILDDGLFHADPHPGNIAVAADGSLIFYDFGMMGRVRPDVRLRLMDTFLGIAQKDANQVINALIELGALVPTGDMSPVRRSIQYMLDNFMDRPLEVQSVEAITDDLYEIAYDRPFRFPATFTFVMRAFSTLEGVGKGLSPSFNFMEVAQPFALKLMTNGTSSSNSFFGELSRQAAQVSTTALTLPRRIEDTLEKLEQGDVRVRVRSSETERLLRHLSLVQMATNYAVLLGTFTIASAILIAQQLMSWAILTLAMASVAALAFFRLLLRLKRLERFSSGNYS